jgi:hypothetical protein
MIEWFFFLFRAASLSCGGVTTRDLYLVGIASYFKVGHYRLLCLQTGISKRFGATELSHHLTVQDLQSFAFAF